MKDVRTWIEIDAKALRHNAEQFLKLIPPAARFMAVVKSNAYGHGLVYVAKALLALRSFSEEGWFGVDSIVEALRLRREGIKNPILVLGLTLPSRLTEAVTNGIALTISNFDALEVLAALKNRPPIHIKIDTGMHRQGFLPHQTRELIKLLKLYKLFPHGVYTHFASAKDPADPAYTELQLSRFQTVLAHFDRAGIKSLIRHAASSGGVLLFPESHLDMVRIGMGLYGYYPSEGLGIRDEESGVMLKPVLTWKTIVGEVKEIPKGSYVGYDGTERVERATRIAVLPIGYWHGYDRVLSSIGEVLICGRRTKVLGRVSMDMTVVDVTDVNGKPKTGDEVVIIGEQGREAIWADEIADKIGTSQYELLTRINPLIKRIAV